jgi:hypothetical protein
MVCCDVMKAGAMWGYWIFTSLCGWWHSKKKESREALAGVLLRSFTVVGSQVAKGNWEHMLSQSWYSCRISLQCFLYVMSFSLVWTMWALCNTAQFDKTFAHGWTNPRYPDFGHKKTKESLWLNDTWIFCPMGESPVGSKGTMQCTLQSFSTVYKACKICQVWSMSRNIVSFWTIACRGHCSRHHVQVYEHMKRAHTLLSYEVSSNWMHRWVVVLSTCVPNVQA